MRSAAAGSLRKQAQPTYRLVAAVAERLILQKAGLLLHLSFDALHQSLDCHVHICSDFALRDHTDVSAACEQRPGRAHFM